MSAVARVVILSCDVCGKPGDRAVLSYGSEKWHSDLCDGCLAELVKDWRFTPVPTRRPFTVYKDEKQAKDRLAGP